MPVRVLLPLFAAILFACPLLRITHGGDDILVGPRTEDRFPPLVIPDGFHATLFACDPLVEYPSVIALGPRLGTLFVAHDYMTGLGVEIIRRDEIRLLEDSDGDGYADRSTLYADGFNSIQGLAFDGDAVYAMHAPFLTRLRDADGDGDADERRDLIDGLGLPPEENPNRLHCANGVVVGHDGWLYLALGDRGCDTVRPEGDRLLFQRGGILRCRPDGTDLHVFSTGLRNIYDVALDEDLNVFVRDNENDGGDYMIRVCHCFLGSDHGYPYHYYERPDEAMPPLADLGRGSSAGGTAYLETAFPEEFRSSLYFCEWGRAVVRYPLQASGSGFTPVEEFDFAAGADDDPYGFKPTDLVVDYDGSLLVSDWCDGQRPQRGRGRIYRIEFDQDASPRGSLALLRTDESSATELISQLDSVSSHTRVAAQTALQKRGEAVIDDVRSALRDGRISVRGRLHAVWILAQVPSPSAVDELFALARSDTDPRVTVQAIRAIADLSDPVLVQDQLDAGRGDPQIADRLVQLAATQTDARVLRETTIALGRLGYADAANWVWDSVAPDAVDPALEHALVQLLRRSDNWPAVLDLLDADADAELTQVLRHIALRAMAEQAESVLADGLIERLDSEPAPERRMEYADLLSRVCRLPRPWTFWGFRPGPRPVNRVSWDRTADIEAALTRRLSDPDHEVRVFVLGRIMRENLPVSADALGGWLRDESRPEYVASILDALSSLPADEIRLLLEDCVRDPRHTTKNRLAALEHFTQWLDAGTDQQLLRIARDLEDGPVLAGMLAEIGTRPAPGVDVLLLANMDSEDPAVRAAAVRALTERGANELRQELGRVLADSDVEVLRAAVAAAGVFEIRAHADRVLELAAESDLELRRECLLALRRLADPRAVDLAVTGLSSEITRLAGLAYLERLGGAAQLEAVVEVSQASLDAELQSAVVRTIAAWQGDGGSELQQAIARIQGRSGVPLLWHVALPQTAGSADATIARILESPLARAAQTLEAAEAQIAAGADARVLLQGGAADEGATVWLAATEVFTDEEIDVELLASSQGTLAVWINNDAVFERHDVAEYQPDSDRFPARLGAGWNRMLARVERDGRTSRFQLRFRRRSSKAEHEQLVQQVLGGRGDVERGRAVFADTEKSLCLKCHRLGAEGARIGPDLTGVGARFSRVHILESILEPSRTIAPSYASVTVLLEDGRVLSGVRVAEDESSLTIGDSQGNSHQIPRDAIEEIRDQETSTMPVGLERRLTAEEFLDLIEFLTRQTAR